MNDILTTLTAARAVSEAAGTAAPPTPGGDPAEFMQLLDRFATMDGISHTGGDPHAGTTAVLDTTTRPSNEAAADAEAAPQLDALPPDAAALAALVGQMQAAYLRPAPAQTGVGSEVTPTDLAAPPAMAAAAGASLPNTLATSDLAHAMETQAAPTGPDSAQTPAQPSEVAAAREKSPNVTMPTHLQETATRIPMAATAPLITTDTLSGPTTAAATSPALARSANPLVPTADALAPDDPALDALSGAPQFSQQALRDFLIFRTGTPAPAPEANAQAAMPYAAAGQAESAASQQRVGPTPFPLGFESAPLTEHASELSNRVASAMNALSVTKPGGRASLHTEAYDTTGVTASALSATAVASPVQDAGPPQLTIAPRLDAPEWKAAFAGGVRLLVQEGANSASLQLNPAELGPIDVRIQVTDQRADISFLVKSSDANAAIQSALNDLREQLARSGIELGQTNVGSQREHAQHPGHAPWRDQAQHAPVPPRAHDPQPVPRQHASGQIDTFA